MVKSRKRKNYPPGCVEKQFRKTSRKHRSVKRKVSRKRKSSKRKVSRKRKTSRKKSAKKTSRKKTVVELLTDCKKKNLIYDKNTGKRRPRKKSGRKLKNPDVKSRKQTRKMKYNLKYGKIKFKMQTTCLRKLNNLENRLTKILNNVYTGVMIITKPGTQAKPTTLGFYGTRRTPLYPGYYLFTIQGAGISSHGIIIERRISMNDGTVSYHLFDPNGTRYTNQQAGGYNIDIVDDNGPHTLKTDISPQNLSWNPMGYCGLWTSVMAIFFSNFPATDRTKFYKYLKSNHVKFIEHIMTTIINHSGEYDTEHEVGGFIEYISDKINKVIYNN